MKSTLAFLSVACLAFAVISSAPQNASGGVVMQMPNMADSMKNFLNALKHIAPCGDATTGIPILAPFTMPIVSLDINHELLVLNGSISNMVITGLTDFVLIELATNETTMRTSFDMLFKDIQLLGDYNLYVNADLAGYKFVVNLQGLMNLQVLDIRVSGAKTLSKNANGGVLFTDVDIDVQFGDIISHILDTQWSVAFNDYFNKYVRDTWMIWVQTNRVLFNQEVTSRLTEQMNAPFANLTAMEYMMGMVKLTDEWNAISCTAP